MGEYLKLCESAIMKNRATEEEALLISSKKRKFYSDKANDSCGGGGGVEPVENSVSPAASRTSGCSKHEESSGIGDKSLRSPDLEKVDLHSDSVETEISTCNDGVFSREGTPTSEFYGDSEQVSAYTSSPSKRKSSTPPAIPRRKNMPSAAELEEFFAAAEKYEQKRFAEKYNYDIVNDVPLEGTYQWVRLQP